MPNNTVDDIRHFVESVSGYSGQTVGPTAYRDKLLNLEPGVVYPASSGSSFNGTMRLTIENDLTVDIPFYELDMPLRGLDGQGNPVLDPDYRELQIYGSAASGDAPVLGKAFLSQVSSLVAQRHRVGVASNNRVLDRYTWLSIMNRKSSSLPLRQPRPPARLRSPLPQHLVRRFSAPRIRALLQSALFSERCSSPWLCSFCYVGGAGQTQCP